VKPADRFLLHNFNGYLPQRPRTKLSLEFLRLREMLNAMNLQLRGLPSLFGKLKQLSTPGVQINQATVKTR